MSAATVITSGMANVPVMSGTEGALSALIRYLAPILGWDVVFDEGGPVIVVRPQSYKTGQALLYRFDDTGNRGGLAPRAAEVRAYESMSDINSGAGLVGPVYVHKSYYANTSSQKYFVIGDAYGFFLGTNAVYSSYYNFAWNAQYFGFLNESSVVDTPVCALFGSPDAAEFSSVMLTGVTNQAGTDFMFIHRDRDGQLNKSVIQMGGCGVQPSGLALGGRFYAQGQAIGLQPYPHCGTLLFSKPYVNNGDPGTVTGYLPGLVSTHHSNDVGAYISDAPAEVTSVDVDGHTLVPAVHIVGGGGSWLNAFVAYDIGEGFRP